jgi:sugar/nucleoside kinase (ribokinase family)
LAEGVSSIAITLGSRGVVYFAAPGFEKLSDVRRPALGATSGAIRTAKLPAKPPRHAGPGDPTGCGDVWGATYFSRLLAGDKLETAIDRALDAAARNVDHRGATGLADYLRGELSIK